MGDNHGMWFGILGTTEVRQSADGSPVNVGGPRVRSLLALLLLNAGQLISAEGLIDGLYGEHPPGDAANALQSQVSRLRKGLRDAGGSSAIVEFHPAGYRLAVHPDDVDAHRFERLTREGQRAMAAGDNRGAAALLGEALALWRGPALADVPFAEAQATRLAELRVTAAEDRAEAALALGEHRGLVAELQELVAAHPLRERPRGQLMRALYGSGRQAEALAVFEDARRILADELGTDPSAELAEVHLAILRAEPSLAATPPSTSRLGLPAQLTSFVGRDEELDRVGALLRASRLVTLSGPGGGGKTRLAIEASGREDGDVCFVDLAPVGDGTELPRAVLGALGLREANTHAGSGAAQDVADRLVGALAGRRLLLVLDNCEHVIDAAARLVHRLLGACPGLRVLATSREALGITGEALSPVPPLPVPPADATPEQALAYPAVRLFADRATAVRQDFAVRNDNLGAVLRICTALDGLPLAIELAAARLRSLGVEEIAARLDDRFRLLSRGSRTAAPRHQTLRAVVEWSWDLLDETEQTLARRLTVFAGGATLDAAARVCGLPEDEVDELLAGLSDKSLVEAGGGRYRMLETVRQFGADRLAEADEQDRVRAAHAAYFLDLAETADPHLRRAEQLEWLARLAAEHGNLQAALRWSVDSADTRTALCLHAALSSYWRLRGQRTEGTPLARALLKLVDPTVREDLAEEYVLCVVSAVSGGSAGPEFDVPVREAHRIMGTLDRPLHRPFLLVAWALYTGPPAEGDPIPPLFKHFAASTDLWIQGLLQLSIAFQFWLVNGAPTEAEREFRGSLAKFRTAGDRWGIVQTLTELATLVDLRGDRAEATELIDEALELTTLLGAAEETSDLLANRADNAVRAGDLDPAHGDYEAAIEAAGRAGAPEKAARAQHGLGNVARLRGDLAEARRWCDLALAGSPSDYFGVADLRANIQITLGQIAVADGDADGADGWYREALSASTLGGSTAGFAGSPGRTAADDGTTTDGTLDDEKTADDKTGDDKTADDKTADDKTADDKTADDKTADDKTADDKTADERTADGDVADMLARYRDALGIAAFGGANLRIAGSAAEGLAGVALLNGDAERAALLLGVGVRLRGSSVAGDPDVARIAGRAAELLGRHAYVAAFDRGAALSRDEALAELHARRSVLGA
ncbi:AfsR/SARP family transcriptional regulator [Solihabitans fulvus]|uniref:AfsR/SARP family transcriptional regulator n=1 Tax=Solihabitans fulvus TaxID=1892852 RepID=A0A5B2X0Y7_9PSEU|nr:BTAD domain-containing putative transcriptional regulator [Solihabitans fulvus]KAA2256922.1 AfsR/SARP family transcriptional regulator [Solihabitans fulvus]